MYGGYGGGSATAGGSSQSSSSGVENNPYLTPNADSTGLGSIYGSYGNSQAGSEQPSAGANDPYGGSYLSNTGDSVPPPIYPYNIGGGAGSTSSSDDSQGGDDNPNYSYSFPLAGSDPYENTDDDQPSEVPNVQDGGQESSQWTYNYDSQPRSDSEQLPYSFPLPGYGSSEADNTTEDSQSAGVVPVDDDSVPSYESVYGSQQPSYPLQNEVSEDSGWQAVTNDSYPLPVNSEPSAASQLPSEPVIPEVLPHLENTPNVQATEQVNIQTPEKLPDLRLDKRRLISHFFLDTQTVQSLLCARGEGCLASTANGAHLQSKRRLLRFETTVHNDGEVDFYPAMKKEDWIWHACHNHSHSMGVFTYYDLLDENRQKVAEGHKASFCLEDSECVGGAKKKFDCLKGHQGISPGCMDIYKAGIDCQWIDITDVVLGEYTLQVLTNPQRLVPESNWANNGIECKVLIKRFTADIWGCKETSV